MRRRRSLAVAGVALLGAALAAAGCGFGPGASVGGVSLTVTRDFGAARVQAPLRDEASESDTAMRLLDRDAEVATSYGGRYVRAIDGLAEAARDGRRYDWFFYVDGVLAPVGAADVPLGGGEAIWWDYHDWSSALGIPAVVGSWPAPLVGGYEGKRHPVSVECRGAGAACALVRSRLRQAGVAISSGSPEDAIRVLVGPWARLRDDPAAAQLERGPQASGVFAEFTHPTRSAVPLPRYMEQRNSVSFELLGLDQDGEVARAFGPGAGLVAATRRYEAPPVWIVSGTSARGVRAAAGLLDAADLRDRFAVVTEAGRETSLPVESRTR